MINKLGLFAWSLSAAFILSSCGGGGDDEVATYEKIEDEISAETDVKLDLVMYDIPTPVEVARDIATSGAAYNKTLLNSSSKAGSYSTNYKKAVNLGIFIADLSYAAVYDQTQDATSYLSSATKLAESLGIAGAFNQEMIKAFQDNLGNKDTLTTLIDVAYSNADKFLRTNDRASTAALVLAGGWIEGMYISTQVLGNANKSAENKSIYERVGSQKLSVSNLASLLEDYKDKEGFGSLYGSIAALDTVTYKKVSGPSNISRAQVNEISKSVNEIRSEMVK